MRFEFDGLIYPLVVQNSDGYNTSDIVHTIAPNEHGDYYLLSFCTLDGVSILNTVCPSRVKILVEVS